MLIYQHVIEKVICMSIKDSTVYRNLYVLTGVLAGFFVAMVLLARSIAM